MTLEGGDAVHDVMVHLEHSVTRSRREERKLVERRRGGREGADAGSPAIRLACDGAVAPLSGCDRPIGSSISERTNVIGGDNGRKWFNDGRGYVGGGVVVRRMGRCSLRCALMLRRPVQSSRAQTNASMSEYPLTSGAHGRHSQGGQNRSS